MELRLISRLDSGHLAYPTWVPQGTLVERQVGVNVDYDYGPPLVLLLDQITTTLDEGPPC
jgi:hypothetical protein